MRNIQNTCLPKQLATRTIYESDWVSLYADRVEMPDGTIIESYHRLHYPQESVCVVPFNEKGEVLLIQSKRYVTGRLEWEVPAGRSEHEETVEEAARRECWEETGCTLRELTYLCLQNPLNGMADLKMHVFGATVSSETGEIDENEVCEKRWFAREQVLQMLQNNEIRCGISMMALLYAFSFYGMS